jgi:hypothetical protein
MLASGSGGHEISVKGFKGWLAASLSSLSLVAFRSDGLSAVSVASSSGAGASGRPSGLATATQALSVYQLIPSLHHHLQRLTFVPLIAWHRTASQSAFKRTDAT